MATISGTLSRGSNPTALRDPASLTYSTVSRGLRLILGYYYPAASIMQADISLSVQARRSGLGGMNPACCQRRRNLDQLRAAAARH